MKKVWLVSIVLGVLLLVGVMSGWSAARMIEGSTTEIPDYESFPHKYQSPIDGDKDRKDRLITKSYIRKMERRDSDKQVVIIAKDIIVIVESPSSIISLLAWTPEISITIDKATDTPDVIHSITRYAIKENGQWKFIDEQTYTAKLIELTRNIKKR